MILIINDSEILSWCLIDESWKQLAALKIPLRHPAYLFKAWKDGKLSLFYDGSVKLFK